MSELGFEPRFLLQHINSIHYTSAAHTTFAARDGWGNDQGFWELNPFPWDLLAHPPTSAHCPSLRPHCPGLVDHAGYEVRIWNSHCALPVCLLGFIMILRGSLMPAAQASWPAPRRKECGSRFSPATWAPWPHKFHGTRGFCGG